MIAEKYGYWVSPIAAVNVAETRDGIEQMKKAASAAETSLTRHLGGGAALLFIGIVLAALTRSPVFAIFGFVLGLALCVAGALQSAGSGSPDSVTPLLKRNPWQAWPCRVDGVGGNPDSRKKIVYLMSPDQQVVKAFETPMPHQAWEDLTDGMGVLWVCGDLRYPVAMGTVHGTRVWLAKPARKSAAAPVATAVFTDVISGATTKAIEELLNP